MKCDDGSANSSANMSFQNLYDCSSRGKTRSEIESVEKAEKYTSAKDEASETVALRSLSDILNRLGILLELCCEL